MTHDERMHQLLYSNEGRVEQCERICRLEELVRELYEDQCDECDQWKYRDRIRDLGVKL